jgi:hypothetical protein
MKGSPDVLVGGEEDDGPGVPRVQEQTDDLVKVRRFVVMGDLQGLGDAYPTWRRQRRLNWGSKDGEHFFIFRLLPLESALKGCAIKFEAAGRNFEKRRTKGRERWSFVLRTL